MLPTSVIIILREVLEAALLISILSAQSNMLGMSRRWMGPGIGLGLFGAVIYGLSIGVVSEWFGGFGQELVNATMQGLIYLLLVCFVFLVMRYPRHHDTRITRLIPVLMALAVALAVTREGFEILVYLYGFSGIFSQLLTVSMGAIIGAGIGISTGVLLYYLLCHPAIQRVPVIGFGLLALFGAGLLSQAIMLLIQANWLPSQMPLWDTTAWLPESSVTGQLLYVLVGYEATPTAIQVIFHFSGLLLVLLVVAIPPRPLRFFPRCSR